jgi:hypothetical protein
MYDLKRMIIVLNFPPPLNHKIHFDIFSIITSTLLINNIAYGAFDDVSEYARLEDNDKKAAFGNPTWADFNNDGLLDMLSSRHNFDMNVYINLGDGTFFNNFENSNLYQEGTWDHHGFALADYNNDGNIDIFIAEGGYSGQLSNDSQLWYGDGKGSFENVSEGSGIIGIGRSGIALDFNNDGNIDILKLQSDINLYRNNGDDTFDDITREAGLSVYTNGRISGCAVDYDFDNDMDILLGGYQDAVLLENNGNESFTEVFTFPQTALTHSLAWGDYDNDGDLDVVFGRGQADYAAGLILETDRLYFANNVLENEIGALDFTAVGEGEITFRIGSTWFTTSMVFLGRDKVHPSSIPFTISNAAGEPQITENDPHGIYLWNDENTYNWHIRWISGSRHNFSAWGEIVVSQGMEITDVTTSYDPYHTDYTVELYENEGNGVFSLVTELRNVTHIGNHKGGVIWGDYDNDRDLDLYIVDSGTIAGNEKNVLFQNDGYGNFIDVTSVEQVDAMQAIGRHYGAAWGDYDNDGYLDLFLSQGNGFGTPDSLGKEILYRNLEKDMGNANTWLKINLEGIVSNSSGIGATVKIHTDNKVLIRHSNGGGGGQMYSQGAGPLHFGLGNDDRVENIKIHWPSGITQNEYAIQSGQQITIIEKTNPTLAGTPSMYHAGSQEGAFVWKDTADGEYHLRVSGNGDASLFTVKVISTEPILATMPYSLEERDEWIQSTYQLTLKSNVSTHEDGFDFSTANGAQLLISVEKDGASKTSYLRSAVDGVPFSPAGWIISADQLTQLPEYSLNDDGLFVGLEHELGILSAHYVSGQVSHRVNLMLLSSNTIDNVLFHELEDDITLLTENSVTINGYIIRGMDGVEFSTDTSSDIGIVYKNDDLFQPRKVFLNNMQLNSRQPNAYLLQ